MLLLLDGLKNISFHIILFLSLSPHPSKRSISFVVRENILGQASVNDPPLVSSRFVLDRGAKKKKEVREIPVVSHSQRRKTKTSCCCSKKKKRSLISLYYLSSNKNSFSRSNSFVSNCTQASFAIFEHPIYIYIHIYRASTCSNAIQI